MQSREIQSAHQELVNGLVNVKRTSLPDDGSPDREFRGFDTAARCEMWNEPSMSSRRPSRVVRLGKE